MSTFIPYIINRKGSSISLLLFIFFVLPSCTEKIEWELDYREADLIVVEGQNHQRDKST